MIKLAPNTRLSKSLQLEITENALAHLDLTLSNRALKSTLQLIAAHIADFLSEQCDVDSDYPHNYPAASLFDITLDLPNVTVSGIEYVPYDNGIMLSLPYHMHVDNNTIGIDNDNERYAEPILLLISDAKEMQSNIIQRREIITQSIAEAFEKATSAQDLIDNNPGLIPHIPVRHVAKWSASGIVDIQALLDQTDGEAA